MWAPCPIESHALLSTRWEARGTWYRHKKRHCQIYLHEVSQNPGTAGSHSGVWSKSWMRLRESKMVSKKFLI
jgi:hypothetical protein